MTNNRHSYGCIPDIRDHRDHLYSVPIEHLQALPPMVDLRPQCPPVYDQSSLGSCTSQGIAAAIEFDRKKQSLPDIMPSRLFIYYNERAMEGTVSSDSGASIRDGIKVVNAQGVCPESEWTYDILQFTVNPPAQCYQDALKDRALSYQRVARNLDQMKGCLASGYPVIIGISVYESFESAEVARTGMVPMPTRGESLLGGHCVLLVGYRDDVQKWILRNSWSEQWGDQGHFYLDYAYLMNKGLSSDFWTIKTVGA